MGIAALKALKITILISVFLIVQYLLVNGFFPENIIVCGPGEFPCESEGRCLRDSYLCDGLPDCIEFMEDGGFFVAVDEIPPVCSNGTILHHDTRVQEVIAECCFCIMCYD